MSLLKYRSCKQNHLLFKFDCREEAYWMSTFVFPSLCTNNHTRNSEILMHILVYWFARKIQKLYILQFHTLIQNGYMQKIITQAFIYLYKVNNGNTSTMDIIRSKFDVVLMSLLLTLGRFEQISFNTLNN